MILQIIQVNNLGYWLRVEFSYQVHDDDGGYKIGCEPHPKTKLFALSSAECKH